MASHFVSLNRGQEGSNYSDFVTGAASSGNVGIELRLDDASAYTRKDILMALEAFERFFENQIQSTTAGFVING